MSCQLYSAALGRNDEREVSLSLESLSTGNNELIVSLLVAVAAVAFVSQTRVSQAVRLKLDPGHSLLPSKKRAGCCLLHGNRRQLLFHTCCL